jgi:hypothetical protein
VPTDRSKQKVYLNRNVKYPNRPWHARQKRDGIEFHLGFFATREEAVAAEEAFDLTYPRLNQRGAR